MTDPQHPDPQHPDPQQAPDDGTPAPEEPTFEPLSITDWAVWSPLGEFGPEQSWLPPAALRLISNAVQARLETELALFEIGGGNKELTLPALQVWTKEGSAAVMVDPDPPYRDAEDLIQPTETSPSLQPLPQEPTLQNWTWEDHFPDYNESDDLHWVNWAAGLLLTNHAEDPAPDQSREWLAQASRLSEQDWTNQGVRDWIDRFPDALMARLNVRHFVSKQADLKFELLRRRFQNYMEISPDEIDEHTEWPVALCNLASSWKELLERAVACAATDQPAPEDLPWATLACDLRLAMNGFDANKPRRTALSSNLQRRIVTDCLNDIEEASSALMAKESAPELGALHGLIAGSSRLKELRQDRLLLEVNTLGLGHLLQGSATATFRLEQFTQWPRRLRSWYAPETHAALERGTISPVTSPEDV